MVSIPRTPHLHTRRLVTRIGLLVNVWFVGRLANVSLRPVTVVSVNQMSRGRLGVASQAPTLVTPQGCVVLSVGTGSTNPRCGVWTTTSVNQSVTPPVGPVARLSLQIQPPLYVLNAHNAAAGAATIVITLTISNFF